METVTYTKARESLASVLEKVASTREGVIIKRRGHEDIALIPADELSGLMETAHLLRSPKNAKRLLEALSRSHRGGGTEMEIDDLERIVAVPADH